MFPGANAQIYRNDAGEPLGWDTPSDEPPDPEDFYDNDYDLDDEEPNVEEMDDGELWVEFTEEQGTGSERERVLWDEINRR